MAKALYTPGLPDESKIHAVRSESASNCTALQQVVIRFTSLVAGSVRNDSLTRRLVMVTTSFPVILFSASTSFGGEDSGTAPCPAQFHSSPTISRDLFVDRAVEDDFVQRITAHADYWVYPNIPSFFDGRMDVGASFNMMISDASPPSKEYDHGSRSSYSLEHFGILVRATSERPVWVFLAPVSEAGKDHPQMVTLENGIVVRGPGDIEYTDDVLYGFERVTWVSGQRYPYHNLEYYVLRDDRGDITEILECREDGSVPNPGCRIDFKKQPLWVTLSFRKYLMDSVPTIRQHAHRFVRCILQ